MKNTLLIFLFLAFNLGCVPQSRFDRLTDKMLDLEQQIIALNSELDNCENGAVKIFAKLLKEMENQNYNAVINLSTQLKSRHPGSEEEKASMDYMRKAQKAIEINEKNKIESARLEKVREEKKIRLALGKLRSKYDEFTKTTYYFDKNSPSYVNRNGFYISIGKKEGFKPTLNLSIQYVADDWLFIEAYTIMVDDLIWDLNEERYGEIQSDNAGGKIWEWLSRPMSDGHMVMLEHIANGKDVKVRFHGKNYNYDRKISKREQQGFKNVLDGYRFLFEE